MAEQQNVSSDQELTPESLDSYGEYYKLNEKESTEAGTEVEEDSQEEVQASGEEVESEEDSTNVDESKEKATDVEPTSKGERKSGYERSIGRLTRQKKEAQERISALEKQLKEAQEAKSEPVKKLKPDNFLTNEEYVEAVAEQKAKALIDAYVQDSKVKSLTQEIENENNREFSENWNDKVNQTFTNAEDKKAFNELVEKNGDLGLPKDVHDYLDYSDDGPQLYTVLALRPDILKNIKSKSEAVRSLILRDLEKVINQGGGSSNETKPQITKAPDPIGSVQSSSSGKGAVSDEDLYNAYMKKNYGS